MLHLYAFSIFLRSSLACCLAVLTLIDTRANYFHLVLEHTYNDIIIINNIIHIVNTLFNFFVHIININIVFSYLYSSSCHNEQPFLYCC